MIKGSVYYILKNTFRYPLRKMGCLPLISLFIWASSFQRANPPKEVTLMIHFRAYNHGEPLQLNKNYRNPFGEIFRISRFRFYAGKITPVYSEAGVKPPLSTDYHLVDFSDSSSTYVEVPATAGLCNGIQFLLGVDSADQVRGAQTGVLDPMKGMFWTWNSGYQSFKIEGSSPLSTQPAHSFAFHIGGYRSPYSTVWNIRIYTTDNELFRITKENKIIVEVPIEFDYFFDGSIPLHIKESAVCTIPGEQARKISENFVGTFTGLTLF